MSLHSPLAHHQHQQHSFRHPMQQQQQHQNQPGRETNTQSLTALNLAAAASFFSSGTATATMTTIAPTTPSPTARLAAASSSLYPISTTIPSPVHHSISAQKSSFDHLSHTIMVNANGSTQPFAFQPPHNNTKNSRPASTVAGRSHTQHKHHQHHSNMSSLPSPPLSSVEPPLNSDFFLKSPLQERCEALETELSALRTRLKRSERSSTIREKRLSIFQQQSTDSHHSLQSLKTQHDTNLVQLQQAQRDLASAQSSLSTKDAMVRHLEAMAMEQESQLKEVLADREALATEMMESHNENAKQQKRLKNSTDKVEKLQQENRQLIEQLRELSTKVVDVSDAKLDAMETMSREKAIDGKTIQELEKETAKSRKEIDRLQDLVMNMGNRHVQVQAQLSFFQQQAIQLQQQLDLYSTLDGSSIAGGEGTGGSVATKHSSLVLTDGTLSSLLSSVATVATTSLNRRSKPTRRFTVNAPRKVDDLTMEQRKCQFLMDQIAVLQRGYDSLRQEKVTLELQIDLMQRQHQYHQQQRQKRRESQRRTLGHEQSAALSKSLAIIVNNSTSPSPSSSGSALSAVPSTPLLPTISAAEQEREKARIQYELEQAQIRAQQQEQEQELQRQAAKVAAEEAEREAIRLRRAKSIHLKETLASLESRRGRSDSRDIQFSPSEELKHLEHLRLANDGHPATQSQPQQQQSLMSQQNFQSAAAAARASRRIGSPLSLRSSSSSPSKSPLAMSSTGSSPSSSSLKKSANTTYYTHHHRAAGFAPTYNIEQCSCCIGSIIDI
ncbi:hypothetical protein EC957_004082 [Mortierella hygrophila]|uniref:Uncharacterized protein n=1 Tax=Mortierella hygrophila TaxID=979708 RepID=A0A9P6FI04_9FUNG|nr:hypothetical protein EC957_004082 [Mortierella hygrophila]